MSDYLNKRILYKVKPDIEIYEGFVLEISPDDQFLCIGKINSLIFEWYHNMRITILQTLPDELPESKIKKKKKNDKI